VRGVLNKHVGSAVGAAAVSLVSGAITSRIRLGLFLTAAGFALIATAFWVRSWLPLFWPSLAAA